MTTKKTHRKSRPLPRSRKTTPPKQVNSNSFRVVALGASAGGLEAFSQVLRPLPIDTGMAFVLIQHLDPAHKSMLTDILRRETRMPVHEVENRMVVEPNHVYVIPPNAQMSLQGGRLHLVPRDETREGHTPIDYFFLSLAKDKGAQAVAVVLSGADADGSHALGAIRAGGGKIFAQDPRQAKFKAMPSAAVQSGVVDFILPLDRMAQKLVELGKTPQASLKTQGPNESHLSDNERDLADIYAFLASERGVDFAHYKQTTLKRRIQRRMMILRSVSLKAYVALIKTHPLEATTLFDDLLIHVTHFFRDTEVFEGLKKKVFPQLLENRSPKDMIRIWVPGCSTGEEVYSIAICLLEYLGKSAAQTPIQIFATDISEPVLKKARIGIYSAASMESVSAEWRRLYFRPVPGGTFQINKSIRSLCVFSKQNVAKDPPFSRLDLISCRNVLIYLDSQLQKTVLPIFHYALKPAGLLLLGKSESLVVCPDLFVAWDRRLKVYSKSATSPRPSVFFSTTNYPIEASAHYIPESPEEGGGTNMLKEADQYVLDTCSPAGVIIDGAMNIIQFRGAIGQYLELVSGSASFHLFKLLKEGLLLELRPLIQRAKKDHVPVTQSGSRVMRDGHFRQVALDVIPLRQSPAQDTHFLVLFREVHDAVPPKGSVMPPSGLRGKGDRPLQAAHAEIARLKQELTATKHYLQSVIDEHERVNEELKSANEESLSSNEEFQSTNEELETAKEELQATNEETLTLNDDLHQRNVELTRLNNDMVNLMNSVNIPTVILGRDQHIRRLNVAAEKLLRMNTGDIGRSIHDLHVTAPVVDLKALIENVLASYAPEKVEFQDVQGRWYAINILPYKTTDGEMDGVVLTFSDIQTDKDLQGKAAAWTEELEQKVKERTAELAQTQSALLQSEKLEAVGRLAGGVAHDFNNLMTGILGMTEEVQRDLGIESVHHDELEDVINAAKKAMAVTKQLLAFGRRQVFVPHVLNVNQIIRGMDKLFQRLLGEDVELELRLDPDLGNVNIDPSNIEQAILNLGLNARDAMPKGGKITIRTFNQDVTGDIRKYESNAQSPLIRMEPGSYVVLQISDQGVGINAEVMPHIFEPFYTTKMEGKGSGLGLATVYGIVKQSGGSISVNSSPAKGATFTIYLPRVGDPVSAHSPESIREAGGGVETILVTEDEEIVRKVVVKALRNKGYTILHANHGREALKISQAYKEPIHLLLTDVVMPGMNGRELSMAMLQDRPDLKVLYMSGYEKETITQRGVLEPGTAFIEKSFTSSSLCRRVREVLDAPAKPKEPYAKTQST